MESLKHLIEGNEQWAESIKAQDPNFFEGLSGQQAPDYLWIGCADSRVPANEIVNLPPGEVFVHRNIANVVVHSDLNCLSVIQYAVEVLKVSHIIVCGHYGCGGVKAALGDQTNGLIDNWLGHIKDVSRFNEAKLAGLSEEKKFDALCELNVKEQVRNVCNTTVVQGAWRNGANLTVHGWIYSLKNGLINDLGTSLANDDQFEAWKAAY